MKLHKPTRTVVELAPEPQEERVVFNASDRVVEASEPVQEVPALVRTSGGDAVPPLEPVQRTMRRVELAVKAPTRIELSPSQPVAESEAAVESETESDEDLLETEQAAIQEELQNEQVSDTPVLTRVSRRQVIELSGPADEQSDGGGDSEGDEEPVGEPTSPGAIPALEPIQREQEAIPPLVMIRDGGALPEGITEIPRLEEYNKMEVAHLLIGRSVEDEEVVLLQSFSERFIRSKKPDEFKQTLFNRVNNHIVSLVNSQTYDFEERQSLRTVQTLAVNAHQAARGVEHVFAYLDNGQASREDLSNYMRENDLEDGVIAANEMQARGMSSDASYVFTWALVKVKIGHDFGSYKLSDLMPTL